MTDRFSEQRIHQELVFDPTRTALLVVDMVNDFLEEGGTMVLLEGRGLYGPIQRLLDEAHRVGMPVFWLNQHLLSSDTLFRKRIPHCLVGTWGAEIVDALTVGPDDIIVPKRRYSGFFQTDLDLHLRERQIEGVIVTGLVTNICVRSTVHDAFFLGYDVIVPEECVAGTGPAQQEVTLYDIDTHYGTVTNLEAVLTKIGTVPAAGVR